VDSTGSPAFDVCRKSDYRAALDSALKINMPRFWCANLALAVACGQLGEHEAARTNAERIEEILRLIATTPRSAAEGSNPPCAGPCGGVRLTGVPTATPECRLHPSDDTIFDGHLGAS
jgi:hypothetical protein